MKSAFYVTTPIYYVNSEPHLGHAYTTILGDVATRFHAALGEETRFQTGTDEHGEKIARAAEARDTDPQSFTDEVSGRFRDCWKTLELAPSKFIRTTDEEHKAVVRAILNKVHDQGDIYFGHYDGHYCVGCERYLTEKELVDGKCADHDTVPEKRSESNWFFKMEKYREWLKDYVETHPDFIQPEGFRNECLALLEKPLGDLSISRPKERVPWGIPIPWDERHVTYVWFDALINYVSGLGYPDDANFARFWPESHHLIAKDILKPHCVFWPTMLKAAGIEPYKAIRIHGYWMTDEGKMSKSRGTVVSPLSLHEKYGNDAFRYYLMRDMSFGRDATFSELGLAERINSDLANDLGNLLNRTVGMVDRYHGGVLHGTDDGAGGEREQELRTTFLALADETTREFAAFRFSHGIEKILEAVRSVNRYVDASEPWNLAKNDPEGDALKTVLASCAEALRIASVLLDPIMPTKMAGIRRQLGMAEKTVLLDDARSWGVIPANTKVGKGEPLFPRIDLKALKAELGGETPEAKKEPAKKEKNEKKEKQAPAPIETPAEIDFADFMKVRLVCAEVKHCERIPKADKLLKCELDAGPEGRPTVCAGLAEWYAPEDMIGKRVLWCANLKPRKMRGTVSHGMIIAVDLPDGNVKLVEPPVEAGLGARIH